MGYPLLGSCSCGHASFDHVLPVEAENLNDQEKDDYPMAGRNCSQCDCWGWKRPYTYWDYVDDLIARHLEERHGL